MTTIISLLLAMIGLIAGWMDCINHRHGAVPLIRQIGTGPVWGDGHENGSPPHLYCGHHLVEVRTGRICHWGQV